MDSFLTLQKFVEYTGHETYDVTKTHHISRQILQTLEGLTFINKTLTGYYNA